MNKEFLSGLRSQSCYPTFRAYIGVVTVVGQLIGIGVAIAAAAFGFTEASIWIVVLGGCVAAVIMIMASITREVSLMVADVADASVDMASNGHKSGDARSAPRTRE